MTRSNATLDGLRLAQRALAEHGPLATDGSWLEKLTVEVGDWLRGRLGEREPAPFTLEHLDASSNVAQRDNAKQRLAEARTESPHGIINVGIFGEGTDSPTLSAVAFLEPRRSPIDVVQAVGRAMRTAEGKELGYVICPVLIPPNADPEQWLATAHPEEGWSELGQILLALRAHDERIENELAELLQIYVPREHSSPPQTVTLVAAPRPSSGRIEYGVYRGTTESVYEILEAAVADSTPLSRHGVEPVRPDDWTPATEPTRIVTAAMTQGGEVTLRVDSVTRDRPRTGEARGTVNVDKSKKRARRMINNGEGRPVPAKRERAKREQRAAEQRHEEHAQQMLDLVGTAIGTDITVNLLARSGLRRDRVARDLNILESTVTEAAYHLRTDELQPALDAHFGLDHLAADKRKAQADGCTIAALLLMNAAMLHPGVAATGRHPAHRRQHRHPLRQDGPVPHALRADRRRRRAERGRHAGVPGRGCRGAAPGPAVPGRRDVRHCAADEPGRTEGPG